MNTAADLAPALGECSGGDSCSLRQALDAAHTGDTIVVPALGGAPTTYTLSSGSLTVTKSVAIAGGGAALVEVSGDDVSTVFTVTTGPTTVSGRTISHGAGCAGQAGPSPSRSGFSSRAESPRREQRDNPVDERELTPSERAVGRQCAGDDARQLRHDVRHDGNREAEQREQLGVWEKKYAKPKPKQKPNSTGHTSYGR